MQRIKTTGAWLAGLGLLALLSCAALPLNAQDAPANVAGAWQVSMQGRNGNTMTQDLTLEQDGANIKGTLKSPRGDRALTGTVTGNSVAWTIQVEGRNGQTFTLNYKATVDGDTMKGTMGGGQFSRDFTAKRAAATQQ